MSYEAMETMLINQIAELRASEIAFANNYYRREEALTGLELELVALKRKLGAVEQILAAMQTGASIV